MSNNLTHTIILILKYLNLNTPLTSLQKVLAQQCRPGTIVVAVGFRFKGWETLLQKTFQVDEHGLRAFKYCLSAD
jgi:hypothetical protein